MNIVIYARYSSHSQTEQSIEGQLHVCTEYAERNGYTIVGQYIDRAIIGKTDERPEFQQMMQDSKKHIFSAVLVYALDRFARNVAQSSTNEVKLKKHGVVVLSATEDFADNPAGKMHRNISMAFAQYYSDELSQKVQRGLLENAKKCLAIGGQVPLGLKVVDKKYEIDSETAPIVVKIFEMYLNNHTMADIIKYLNEQQIRTSKGNPYNKNSIRFILTNKRYIGTYVFKELEFPNKIPAIIDEDTFAEARKIMQKNKKAPARAKAIDEQYILTTKLFCGHCESAMTGACGTSHTNAIHQYYVCAGNKKKVCAKKSVQKQLVEDAVVNAIRKTLTTDNIKKIAKEVVALSEKEKDKSNYNRLKRMLKENEIATKNLVHALEQGQAAEVITAQLEKRQAEKEDIQCRIAQESFTLSNLTEPQICFFIDRFRTGDIDDMKYRQSLVDIFVNKIYLYDDEDGKNKKLTILCNTQDGQLSVCIDELSGSSMGRMVELSKL